MEKLPKIEYAPDDYKTEPMVLLHEGFKYLFYKINGYEPYFDCYMYKDELTIQIYYNDTNESQITEGTSKIRAAINDGSFREICFDFPEWIEIIDNWRNLTGNPLKILLTEDSPYEHVTFDIRIEEGYLLK